MFEGQPNMQQLVLAGGALIGTGLFLLNKYQDSTDSKKTNGIPGTRGNIPFVNATIAFAISPRKFLQDGFDKYGPIFRTRFIGMDTVCLSGAAAANLVYNNEDLFPVKMFDPLMKLLDGFMLIQNGEEHKKNRALLVRALTDSQLRQNVRGIAEAFTIEVNKWTAHPEGVEVYNAMKRAILKVMMKVLFGNSCMAEPDLEQLIHEFERFGRGLLALGRAFVARRNILARLVEIIEERRRICALEVSTSSSKKRQDLLQTMIDSPDPVTGELADTQRIASNCVVVLLAALDTTASTVASVIKLLGEHDEVRAKVIEECAQVWSGCPPISEMADDDIADRLAKLTYLDCVLQETLRVRSPLMSTFRISAADVPIPGTDYIIPKGWMVSMGHDVSFMSDAKSFPEPEKFLPERFLPGGVSHLYANYKGSHFPFSKGIHQCPGSKFALAEAKIIVSILATQSQWPQLMRKCSDFQCQNPALEEYGGMQVRFFH